MTFISEANNLWNFVFECIIIICESVTNLLPGET